MSNVNYSLNNKGVRLIDAKVAWVVFQKHCLGNLSSKKIFVDIKRTLLF